MGAFGIKKRLQRTRKSNWRTFCERSRVAALFLLLSVLAYFLGAWLIDRSSDLLSTYPWGTLRDIIRDSLGIESVLAISSFYCLGLLLCVIPLCLAAYSRHAFRAVTFALCGIQLSYGILVAFIVESAIDPFGVPFQAFCATEFLLLLWRAVYAYRVVRCLPGKPESGSRLASCPILLYTVRYAFWSAVLTLFCYGIRMHV